MMDDIRQLRVLGRSLLVRWLPVECRPSLRRRRSRWVARCEQLEQRGLLSTIQNFDTTPVNYTLQQIGGPPPASVKTGGRRRQFPEPGDYAGNAVSPNNNSISFDTTDFGTFNEVTANWDFRVATHRSGARGLGMSFGLLNTGNYQNSGSAASVLPENGIYNGSLGFGFDTGSDKVFLSLNAAIVNARGSDRSAQPH